VREKLRAVPQGFLDDMSLFDAIGDLFELLFADGVPSPDTLRAQRLARLVVASVALILNVGIVAILDPPLIGTWPVVVFSAATLAAGWVFVFSAVDTVKALPTLSLVSVAAVIVAAGCLAIVVLVTFDLWRPGG
jgi:hypothetical protein